MALDTLHSLKLGTLHQNITQPIFNWAGNLAQGQVLDSIPVATITNSYGVNTIKVWAFDPNGNLDENHINDTLTLTQPNVALSGVYTIGGASPDFITIRQAVTALRQYGICNNTIFNIRAGTYTDTLTIFSINGTANYNITFKSENNDSSSVVLTDFATSNGTINSIIRLSSVQNITFEKITFQKNLTTTATDNSAIHLRTTGINNISIKNCRFIGNNSTSSGIYAYYSNNQNNIKIKNNIFIAITYGIYINNSNGSIDIHNNIFQNCDIAGIYGKDYSGICSISKNYFQTTTSNSGIIGIKLSNINNPKIDKNIFKMKTGYAMHLGNSTYTVENNFIQIDSINNLTNGSAIFLYNTNNTSLLSFNTISTRIYNSGNYSLKTQSTAPIIAKNNIILNLGTQGGIVYKDSPNTILNNNRFFTSSNKFGTVNSTDYPNFNSWKTGTGNDYNSQYRHTNLTGDPGYEIVGDYDLNNAGVAITGITTDIRDSLRSPLTPDIGAYEFNLSSLDAEIKNLKTNDSLLCSGNNPVTITIRNSGYTTIGNLNINWEVNNVAQSSVFFSGTLNSGDTADVILGNYNFRGGNIYKLKFYSSLPNGIADSSNYNDTLFIPSIKTRFSGIYTIGGSNPDFSTFKDAVDTLLLYGLCGPSTFNFRAGNYTSNITIPTITGSSSINSVTFQSELLDSSQVSIIDNGPSLTLNGTQNINFKHLSFQQNLASNNSTISIIGNAKNITISNCSFNNPNGNTTIGTVNAVFTDSTSGNFILTNCLFLANTKLTISSNPNFPSPKNFLIANNNFLNTNETQIINIEELEYERNSNIFDVKILANTNFSISNNRITNGNLTISTGNLIHRKEIFNNIIDSGRLKITSTSPVTIMHNTIVADNINNLNPVNGCINFVGKIQHSKIYNNIFSVRNGNNVYTINDPSFTAGNNDTIFDYNVVYTSGDTVTYSFNSPNEIKKSQWVSNYHQDQHSSFFKPEFTGTHDFHPLNDYHNNNRGTGNLTFNTDLDGIIRNPINPDPGVYEFDVIQTANDVGVLNSSVVYCGSTSNPVDIILKNYGNNPIDSVQIHWTLNGLTQTPYQWQGSLQPDSVINITIGSFTPSMTNNNNLVFFTSLPNGVIDSNTSNDSLALNGHSSSLSGIYTIGGTGADFNSFFDATTMLSQVGVCGPTEFIIANGSYFNIAYISTFQNITGNNEYNTITFRSQSG
ncbi:MAG: hypothetical protein L6Q66_07115, partial [Bacteroidia bacterium]|nr:hypothetical protein [Bacteroidia bacterium]